MSKIREVMDFPNFNKIFRGGKMKKKKMVTWVCKCESYGAKYSCELKTEEDSKFDKPESCPFDLYDEANWKRKKQK